ncbi:hypothetical protein F4561_002724 [Lipingzhangella halophila]|uniref:DUF2277 domain-containing protein n=1 Tax=Lipingzhangella halophila TaxID=1783352 RepID=A0A7W7W3K5_9ACTN|nr:DUF2277 domain-containing protein [Lipingzhangella halophila]MBB4931904.1 hypothetical protein [Lipingzhangella halophila]
MCRNVRRLHNLDPPANETEIREAALQYVRKVSGSAKPSAANQEAFEQAVEAIAATTADLLDSLVTKAPARTREQERARAQARAQRRVEPSARDR